MRPTSARARSGLLAALLLGALSVFAGCDNPACVFSAEGCSEGGGTVGQLGGVASVPTDGARIKDGAPTIEAVFPSGSNVDPRTPIVIRFSESMNSQSLQSAFRLTNANELTPFPIPATSVLTGDGRLLVLFPAGPLPQNGNIQVIFQDENGARDLTGQPLDATPEAAVGNFATASGEVTTPRLVTTWPPAAANDVNERTEIIAVFDRDMQPAPFAAGGFEVTIDDAVPVPDPTPVPLQVFSLGGTSLTDERVWVYRRTVGATSELQAIPPGSDVELRLSVQEPLTDADGGVLEAQAISFTTPAVPSPTSIAISSTPNDAIGIANLTAGAAALELTVELGAAAEGDVLTVLAFGTSLDDEPVLTAVQSSVTLADGQTTQTISLAQTPLLLSSSPPAAVFADGDVYLAVRQRRGGIVTSVRVLDLDELANGVQPAVLDTVAPSLVDLDLPGGGGDQFVSDLRDLTLTGRATEELRAVNVAVLDLPGAAGEVTNADGFADPAPAFVPTIGSRGNGAFVAAPVPVGLVEPVDDGNGGVEVPALTYRFTLYDRALNASEEFAGVHRQYGALGAPGLAVDDTFTVEVVDRLSLEPIAGALVVVGEWDFSVGLVGTARTFVTDAAGRAVVPAPPGSYTDDVVVTVDADGYDLFTLHGLDSRWLGVTLDPVGGATASVAGVVTAGTFLAQEKLAQEDLRLADSRRPAPVAGSTFPSDTCTTDPFTGLAPTCQYGPEVISAGRIGAQAVFIGDLGATSGGMLEAAVLTLPVPAASAGSLSVVDILVPNAFDETENDPEPIDAGLSLEALQGFSSGLDVNALVDDAVFAGVPTISVEARLPGLGRPAVVGVGRTSTAPGLTWDVDAFYDPRLSAQLDAALPDPYPEPDPDPGDGIDPSEIDAADEILHLSMTLVDGDGDRAVVRPRLSQLVTLEENFSTPLLGGDFLPPLVPELLSPSDGGSLVPDAGGNFGLTHRDALIDAYTSPSTYDVGGVFGVRLVDSEGRGWNLYRRDLSNAQFGDSRSLFALSSTDPGFAAPGAGLAPGPLTARVSFWAWQTDGPEAFDPARFAWSDLPREAILIAESRPYTIQLPAPGP